MIVIGNSQKQFATIREDQADGFSKACLDGERFIEIEDQKLLFATTGAFLARGREEAERLVGNAIGWRRCGVGNWHSDKRVCSCNRVDNSVSPLIEVGLEPKPEPKPEAAPGDAWSDRWQIARCVVCQVEFALEADRQIDPAHFHCSHCLEKASVQTVKAAPTPEIDIKDVPF